MKYFIVHVTTQYDGLEWGQDWLVRARTAGSARRKAERLDFTHENGIEVQEIDGAREITKEEAGVIERTGVLYYI